VPADVAAAPAEFAVARPVAGADELPVVGAAAAPLAPVARVTGGAADPPPVPLEVAERAASEALSVAGESEDAGTPVLRPTRVTSVASVPATSP